MLRTNHGECTTRNISHTRKGPTLTEDFTSYLSMMVLLTCSDSDSQNFRKKLQTLAAIKIASYNPTRKETIHAVRELCWAITVGRCELCWCGNYSRFYIQISIEQKINSKLQVLEATSFWLPTSFATNSQWDIVWCALVARSASHPWERAIAFKNVNLPES